MSATKQCACCDEILPREAFNKRTTSSDGLQSYCRACNKDPGRRKTYKHSTKDARLATSGVLRCFKCGQDKDVTDFTVCDKVTGRRFSQCKECCNRYRNAWRYGITVEQWEQLWSDQGGCCLICGDLMDRYSPGAKRKKSAHIDHCHDCDEVRGLLCNECNRGLGAFDDKIDRLYAAIAYLGAHSSS